MNLLHYNNNIFLYPYYNSNEEEKEWQCTLCKDITAISKDLGKYDLDDISDKTVRRKIIERILMELLCRFKDIDHFRDSSPRTIVS